METFYQILGLVGAGLVIWFLYRTIKNQPGQFSRDKISKSLSTLGLLALCLIAFVALLVFVSRVQ